MTDHFIVRLTNHFRPSYGWLPFLLLGGAVACVAFSVLDVGWVEEDGFLLPVMALGFLSATLAALRPMRAGFAWAFLILLGLALSVILIADLWPPVAVFQRGDAAVAEFWKARAALFFDRAAGWLVAVRSGGRSTETVVFALGLALAGWMVATLTAWSAYAARRPFIGLTLAGLALAINTFYGQSALYWAVFFFGLAITAGTYLTHLYREQEWERLGIDYPDEVRTDLILYTAGLSLGLMSLAMAIPAINFRAIADIFQRQDAVVAAEETVSRAFAGIAQPRTDEGTTSTGGMPRSFLLAGGPELAETVVMTATVRSQSAVDLSAFHWRSISFDVYTGRGWLRSAEREEDINQGETIAYPDQPLGNDPVHLTQEIAWKYDRRATRYTLGRPLRFSHDIVSLWRGVDEFVGARGRNNAPNRYTVETAITPATPADLRGASLSDIPPQVRARYTALPDTVPDRVLELAREITGPPANSPPLSPYDQARAIEQFLHQYPYSLDLVAPPDEVDIVDYFLFDLQTGFCDYYASAMVVLARAVGLPARLGVGFLQQPTDADGVQTVSQINAHSWAEVYFAGYGWVEFEPTAPFAVSVPVAPASPEATAAPPTYTPGGTSIAIPERAPQREPPWMLWIGLAAAALVAVRLFGRGILARIGPHDPSLDGVQLAFARLQEGATAIGFPSSPAQTPAEFAHTLLDSSALSTPEGAALRPHIERLAALFAARQYGRLKGDMPDQEARSAWDALNRPLLRLAWRRRLGRLD